MFPSVLEHTLTIVCFCGIILAQELVLLSMIVGAIQLYHRRTFSCSLFVTHVLYLNKFNYPHLANFPDISAKTEKSIDEAVYLEYDKNGWI